MEQIARLDEDFFLLLNGLHQEYLDPIMYWISDDKIWIPLYLLLIFFIFRTIRDTRRSLMVVGLILITIVLSDRITSGLMKPYFERPRPSHVENLEGKIHLVNHYKGGKYGFASSHAANTFALAMFLTLLMHKRWKYVGWILLWAFIVSYSRIYLGVHYPLDILTGALVGVLLAMISIQILKRIYPKGVFEGE